MADYDNVMRKIDYLDDTKQQIKEAIIEKGQQIEDDDPFREYVDKIRELSNGDIRLFNTIEEMNSDQKPKKDGDLAVVYNKTLEPLTNSISFGAIVIPKVINIGSISSNDRHLYAHNINSVTYGELYITIPSYNPDINESIDNMIIQIRNNKQILYLSYIGSNNGLTYTFDTGMIGDIQSGRPTNLLFDTNELFISFDCNISIQEYDDVFTGLFNVQRLDFQGLFQYKLNNLKEHTAYFGNNPHININTSDELTLDYIDWLDYSLFANDIYTLSNKSNFRGLTIIEDVESHIPHKIYVYYDFRYILKAENVFYIQQGNSYSDKSVADEYANTHTFRYGIFDFVNWTYQEFEEQYIVKEVIENNIPMYYIVGNHTFDSSANITNYSYDKNGGYADQDIVLNENGNLYTCHIPYAYIDGYVYAPNQLTLNQSSEILTNVSALGNNGIYIGDGTYLDNITTREYKDYFIPNLPDTYTPISTTTVQQGEYAKYFTLVEREKLKCTDDIKILPKEDTVTILLEQKTLDKLTNTTYTNAYNATYHRTFFTKNNNKLYFGYFGYNMSDKQSSSPDGGTIHEEFHQIYGVLICLDDLTIYREVNYTTTWRPFNGYGNSHEDPNANIIFLNYDFKNDEFVLFVDTGTWGWSSSEAPYLGMMKINGTTNSANTQSWKIGRNNAPNTYVSVDDLRYDLTTQKLILPLKSFNSGGNNSETSRILKMDLSGNKTLWVNNNCKLSNYDYLGGEESFYTFEPIYYYEYLDSSNTKHYCLKRIDDDREIEIPRPYSLSKEYRAIYGGNLYYMGYDSLNDDTYPLIKVNLTEMTYTQYNTFITYYAKFILVDNIPHITYNDKIYSLDNLVDEKYIYYNSSSMYNDIRIDGIINDNGNIQSDYPKAGTLPDKIQFSISKQQIHHWKIADTFPVHNDLCMTYPSTIGNSKVSNTTSLSSSILLASVDYTGTIDPFDYQKALETAIKIEGKSTV